MIRFLSAPLGRGQLLKFGAKQEGDIRRREPLGKSVPDRNRIGDAMNHFPYFIRFEQRRARLGGPSISMGT
jgi:hypothetical protein